MCFNVLYSIASGQPVFVSCNFVETPKMLLAERKKISKDLLASYL